MKIVLFPCLNFGASNWSTVGSSPYVSSLTGLLKDHHANVMHVERCGLKKRVRSPLRRLDGVHVVTPHRTGSCWWYPCPPERQTR